MDSMIPPLFPENQSDLSGDTIESCHHAYISDVQVGVFSGRVKSSLSEDSGGDLGFELAPPDVSGLIGVTEESRVSLQSQNHYESFIPSPETRIISPDDIIPVPLTDTCAQSSSGAHHSIEKAKTISPTFSDIGIYLEKIHKFCSEMDTQNLDGGISGIATLLFYFVEGLDIFVTNKQYGLNNRETFLEMISGDVIPQTPLRGVNTLYKDIRSIIIPRFRAFELEELGLQFIEYFSLYQELKNAKDNPFNSRKTLCKLREFVLLAKVDNAQISTEIFFQRRKHLFPHDYE